MAESKRTKIKNDNIIMIKMFSISGGVQIVELQKW